MRLLLSIGGASGAIYGIRLLEEFNKSDIEVHLVISENAEKIIKHETEYSINKIKNLAFCSLKLCLL